MRFRQVKVRDVGVVKRPNRVVVLSGAGHVNAGDVGER